MGREVPTVACRGYGTFSILPSRVNFQILVNANDLEALYKRGKVQRISGYLKESKEEPITHGQNCEPLV